jgi:hypothetical protein
MKKDLFTVHTVRIESSIDKVLLKAFSTIGIVAIIASYFEVSTLVKLFTTDLAFHIGIPGPFGYSGTLRVLLLLTFMFLSN